MIFKRLLYEVTYYIYLTFQSRYREKSKDRNARLLIILRTPKTIRAPFDLVIVQLYPFN